MHFQKTIKIQTKNKHKIIMRTDSNLIEDNEIINLEENDLIDKAAFILRKLILNIDNSKSPSHIKMEDFIKDECPIPEKLKYFFKALIGGRDIRRRDGLNCERLTSSLASDAIFCVSNGTVKPSKHITLGMTVKSLTNNQKVINILNRFGHSCNYNTLKELETETSSVKTSQICPPDTINGKEMLRDPVGIIYQNLDESVHQVQDMNIASDHLNEMLPSPSKRRRTSNYSCTKKLQVIKSVPEDSKEPETAITVPDPQPEIKVEIEEFSMPSSSSVTSSNCNDSNVTLHNHHTYTEQKETDESCEVFGKMVGDALKSINNTNLRILLKHKIMLEIIDHQQKDMN